MVATGRTHLDTVISPIIVTQSTFIYYFWVSICHHSLHQTDTYPGNCTTFGLRYDSLNLVNSAEVIKGNLMSRKLVTDNFEMVFFHKKHLVCV